MPGPFSPPAQRLIKMKSTAIGKLVGAHFHDAFFDPFRPRRELGAGRDNGPGLEEPVEPETDGNDHIRLGDTQLHAHVPASVVGFAPVCCKAYPPAADKGCI